MQTRFPDRFHTLFAPRKHPGRILCALLAVLLLTVSLSVPVCATGAPGAPEEEEAAPAAPLSETPELIPNWPKGPDVEAPAAILIEARTGTILYGKNIHDHHYPASITKVLTSLIAAERCRLDEVVTFSRAAVFGIPRDSNHIAMREGQTLTIEECLNAILIRSANEVSYAVAEHIGGTWAGFADIMNARAKELGCVDSHFVNPNGLPDENHYVSAYDMAMIGRAFFDNEMLCEITTKPVLILQKEEGEYRDLNKMQLLPGKPYAYPYLVGCKTGYTDAAHNTLISCAEKDGLKLICVVLRENATKQYTDTITLFNYGFSNFRMVNISDAETKYHILKDDTFYSGSDIFGSSKPILSLNPQDSIVLPNTIRFEDTVSSISYDTDTPGQVALITYTYEGVPLGTASVDLAVNTTANAFSFEQPPTPSPDDGAGSGAPSFVFVTPRTLWILAGSAAAVIVIILIVKSILRNYQFGGRGFEVHRQQIGSDSWTRRRRRRSRSPYASIDSLREKRRSRAFRISRGYKSRRSNRFRDYDN